MYRVFKMLPGGYLQKVGGSFQTASDATAEAVYWEELGYGKFAVLKVEG